MNIQPEFVVMLTKKDINVESIPDIIKDCKNIPADSWGFKSAGLTDDEIISISRCLKEAGKSVYLEVVTYTEEEYARVAKIAECGFIYCVTGTIYDPKLHEALKKHGVKYIPIVGKTVDIQGIITKPMAEIVSDAIEVAAKATDGISLMAYRHAELDGNQIIKTVKEAIGPHKRLMIVGSVNSFERIDNVISLGADAFSIGSALFNAQFVPDADFNRNLAEVVDYLIGWEADE